jgi:hypothetical protein
MKRTLIGGFFFLGGVIIVSLEQNAAMLNMSMGIDVGFTFLPIGLVFAVLGTVILAFEFFKKEK